MLRRMRELPRRGRTEPLAPHSTGPGKRDWFLLGGLVLCAALEVLLRPADTWSAASVAVSAVLLPTLLWRRSQPLAMSLLGFGLAGAVAVARLIGGGALPELHTMAALLLLPYALLRWGSGRQALVGVPFIFASSVLGLVSNRVEASDFIGGLAVVATAMSLGAAVRYRANVRAHELEETRLRERERLARDLHDTVAHHVSAIAIRAQAGLAMSASDGDAAVAALRVIESEASRTLAEMRAIVRVLRHHESADRVPAPRIADLERLADRSAEGPVVDVSLGGDLDDLSPAVAAAVYRLAQESITNARRHARRATRIEVGVSADDTSVRLRVADDGERSPGLSGARGFGLTGMIERAELLGGTCNAGPDGERGWTVIAELPRKAGNS